MATGGSRPLRQATITEGVTFDGKKLTASDFSLGTGELVGSYRSEDTHGAVWLNVLREHARQLGDGVSAELLPTHGEYAGRASAISFIVIRPLDPMNDSAACDAIVASLPDWFGLEEGIRECAEAVRT